MGKLESLNLNDNRFKELPGAVRPHPCVCMFGGGAGQWAGILLLLRASGANCTINSEGFLAGLYVRDVEDSRRIQQLSGGAARGTLKS